MTLSTRERPVKSRMKGKKKAPDLVGGAWGIGLVSVTGPSAILPPLRQPFSYRDTPEFSNCTLCVIANRVNSHVRCLEKSEMGQLGRYGIGVWMSALTGTGHCLQLRALEYFTYKYAGENARFPDSRPSTRARLGHAGFCCRTRRARPISDMAGAGVA